MNDGLPGLLPGNPENLLSVEARKRIQRAFIESDKFIWEAEVAIETKALDKYDLKAQALRNKACCKKARAIMRAFRKEFSQLNLPDREYRRIMHEEIDGASNSLELSGAQRHLLETEFFYQEQQPAKRSPAPSATTAPPKPQAEIQTVAAQIERLREECHLTIEELAEKIDMDVRTVERHIAGKIVPYARTIRAYEKVFSKLLNRHIVISKMPGSCR